MCAWGEGGGYIWTRKLPRERAGGSGATCTDCVIVVCQVRLDSCVAQRPGRILYCTTGILLMRLRRNPRLEGEEGVEGRGGEGRGLVGRGRGSGGGGMVK